MNSNFQDNAMNQCENLPIADVQSLADTRQIAINQVGIKSVRHPVRVADKSAGVQHTIANFNMYVYQVQLFSQFFIGHCGHCGYIRLVVI